MTVTIEFPPSEENALRRRAADQGQEVAEFVRQLVRRELTAEADVTAAPVNEAALKQLADWDREDQTDDPEELERRRRQWEEFRRSINENSLSDRPVYP